MADRRALEDAAWEQDLPAELKLVHVALARLRDRTSPGRPLPVSELLRLTGMDAELLHRRLRELVTGGHLEVDVPLRDCQPPAATARRPPLRLIVGGAGRMP